jgi:hypothetical protein
MVTSHRHHRYDALDRLTGPTPRVPTPTRRWPGAGSTYATGASGCASSERRCAATRSQTPRSITRSGSTSGRSRCGGRRTATARRRKRGDAAGDRKRAWGSDGGGADVTRSTFIVAVVTLNLGPSACRCLGVQESAETTPLTPPRALCLSGCGDSSSAVATRAGRPRLTCQVGGDVSIGFAEHVQVVLVRAGDRMVACFGDELMANPTLHGTVDFTARVLGGVWQFDVEQLSPGTERLSACWQIRLRLSSSVPSSQEVAAVSCAAEYMPLL